MSEPGLFAAAGRPAPRSTRAVAFAARAWLAFVWRTARIRTVGLTEAEVRARTPLPCLAVFWHSRLLWPAWAFRGPRYGVLVSDHRDGALVGAIVRGLGTRTVIGSSLRGGSAALRAAAELVADGVTVAVAPDGPLGPAGVARPGVIALASLTGAQIVPMAFAARPAIIAGSWDRLRVPLPGCRAWVGLGEPLAVPRGLAPADLEPHRLALTAALDAITAAVDAAAGVAPHDQRRSATHAH